MTPRERVLAALDHREADRVPRDLAGTRYSSIHAEAYARLRPALGLPEAEIRIVDTTQGLAEIHEYPSILKSLNPYYGALLFIEHPLVSFLALGTVVGEVSLIRRVGRVAGIALHQPVERFGGRDHILGR